MASCSDSAAFAFFFAGACARGGECGGECHVGVQGEGALGVGVAVAPSAEGVSAGSGCADGGGCALGILSCAAHGAAFRGRCAEREGHFLARCALVEGVAVGQTDDVALVHVSVEHLVDVAQAHGALHLLHLLVEGCAFASVGLRWFVGVEPCGGHGLSGGKSCLLCQLLFGGWSVIGVDEFGQAHLIARLVGGEIVVGTAAILSADALDDIDGCDFCHNVSVFFGLLNFKRADLSGQNALL